MTFQQMYTTYLYEVYCEHEEEDDEDEDDERDDDEKEQDDEDEEVLLLKHDVKLIYMSVKNPK